MGRATRVGEVVGLIRGPMRERHGGVRWGPSFTDTHVVLWLEPAPWVV